MQCVSQPTDYISYYPFSGNANDLSYNGYHGVVSSGVRLTADANGVENSAYNFSNYGDRIYLGEEDLFSKNEQLSISFWMNPKMGGFPVQPIFYNNQVDIFFWADLKAISFSVYSIIGGLVIQSEVNSIPMDEWTFVTCIYDGIESKIYLNCQLNASFALPDIEFNMPLEKTYLGSGGDRNDDLLTFYGDLDEVVIFDRGLAEHEVLELLRLVKDGNTDSPSFLSFDHPTETGTALINPDEHTVFLEVMCTSNLAELNPYFQIPENVIAYVKGNQQHSGVTFNDFTNPVQYILVDETICSQQEWIVNITKYEFTAEKIEEVTNLLDISIPEQVEMSIVDNNFLIEVPCNTDLSTLIPSFQVAENVSVFVNGKLQNSGVSSQDFTGDVIYQVGDDIGCYSKDWVVSVRKQMLQEHVPGSIPNVISPNNDSKNDYFMVPDFYLGSELIVLNRFGKRVYHNSDYQNNFQGYDLPAGVYYLLMQNECMGEPYTGTLTILR